MNDVWNSSGSFTFHSNLTKEDWDRITDAEMEHTPRITFKTPSGKETVYVNVENLINRIYEERTARENVIMEFDSLADIIRHFGEVNANKGVLDQINEKQDSLKATCKAWDEAIDRNGYVN